MKPANSVDRRSVLIEEFEHRLGRIGSTRIGMRARRISAGPGMVGAAYLPLLDHADPIHLVRRYP